MRRRMPAAVGAFGLFATLTVAPFYWVIRTALTHPSAIYTQPTALLPPDATLGNFRRVLGLVSVEEALALGGTGQAIDFLGSLLNSLIVSGSITMGQVLSCSAAAYAFARLRFPGRRPLFRLYLAALVVPSAVTLIPNFVLVRQLGLVNTFPGIMAPVLLMTPFAVFFLRQFFLSIPRELEEAAVIDGASRLRTFVSVIVPMSVPALATLAVITFINAWNEYLWPLIVGRDPSVRVLSVALGIFREQTPQGGPDWGGLMAGTILASIPTFCLFLVLGKRIVNVIRFSGLR